MRRVRSVAGPPGAGMRAPGLGLGRAQTKLRRGDPGFAPRGPRATRRNRKARADASGLGSAPSSPSPTGLDRPCRISGTPRVHLSNFIRPRKHDKAQGLRPCRLILIMPTRAYMIPAATQAIGAPRCRIPIGNGSDCARDPLPSTAPPRMQGAQTALTFIPHRAGTAAGRLGCVALDGTAREPAVGLQGADTPTRRPENSAWMINQRHPIRSCLKIGSNLMRVPTRTTGRQA